MGHVRPLAQQVVLVTGASDGLGTAVATELAGARATLRLIAAPELDGVTGRYFDGEQEVAAQPQAYEADARTRLLRRLSEELLAAGR